MNNKPKNLQPNTSADGDNSINTKKGFLISLPSKKKGGKDAESGIIMAKTINETPSNPAEAGRHEPPTQKEPAKKNGGNGNNGNNNRNRNDNKIREKKNPEKQEKTEKTERIEKPERAEKQDKAEKPERDGKPGSQQSRNASRRNGDTNKNGNGNKKQNPRRDEKPDDSAQKSERDTKGGKNSQNNRNNQKKNDTSKASNGEKPDEKQGRQPKKNDRRDRRGDNSNRKPKRSELPGLSPLSKDMQAYAKMRDADFSLHTDKNVKEPSLEEKYKDAIPLAEQIAAEEEKRRRKPRAMITEQIDRSTTANADIAEFKEGEEVSLPDDGRDFEVVGVRFREAGKVYYFDPDGRDIPYGTPVIVETARGAEYGYTAISNRLVPYGSVIPPLKKIKRIATSSDTEKYIANKSLEGDAAAIFKEKVSALGLKMNLVFVEYTFDNTKLLFYFTAETRIDFRELVKELASVFRTRIELRQIGVRDEAKMLGGLGVCGRSVCCNSFLGDFAQVSIKMAKDQGLSLNSAKISGACGKLMCCLRYEDKVYEEEMARTPKVGSVVETADGRGVVTEAQALKGIVKVTLENAPEAPAKAFDREDVKVVGFNKSALKEDAEEMRKLKALEDNN